MGGTRDWVIAAALVPVVSAAALVVAKAIWRLACRFGRWFKRETRLAVGESITELVSPEIKKVGASLGASLDTLREENRTQHAAVESALATLSARQDNVESRLATLEARVYEAGPQTINVSTVGAQGPRGVPGERGPAGEPG